MTNKFIIPIQALLEKTVGSTQDFEFSLADCAFPHISFSKASKLDGTLTYLDDCLLISFSSDCFTCHETCVRCLTECKQITSIDAALESFSLRTPAENDFALLEQLPEGAVLDITPLVEQELSLSFRSLPLCKEDCLGLCPHCGIDRNKKTCDCEQKNHPENPFSQLKSLFPSK